MDGQTERVNQILEMLKNNQVNGRTTYTWLSLHITTKSNIQQNTAHLKFSMEENAVLPSHGVT